MNLFIFDHLKVFNCRSNDADSYGLFVTPDGFFCDDCGRI